MLDEDYITKGGLKSALAKLVMALFERGAQDKWCTKAEMGELVDAIADLKARVRALEDGD